jgi:hypothetical protein
MNIRCCCAGRCHSYFLVMGIDGRPFRGKIAADGGFEDSISNGTSFSQLGDILDILIFIIVQTMATVTRIALETTKT